MPSGRILGMAATQVRRRSSLGFCPLEEGGGEGRREGRITGIRRGKWVSYMQWSNHYQHRIITNVHYFILLPLEDISERLIFYT
jgi:hypothetical protein